MSKEDRAASIERSRQRGLAKREKRLAEMREWKKTNRDTVNKSQKKYREAQKSK